MTITNNYKLGNESGATLVEYSIALGILLLVFLMFSQILGQAARNRAENSMDSVEQMAPCVSGGGGRLSNKGCF